MVIVIPIYPEEWKDINEAFVKPFYQISNYGGIRNRITHKLMSPFTDKDGYLRINFQGYKKNKKYYVHRLVAYYFLPHKVTFGERLFINHRNAIKNYNYFENLEWVTTKENIAHSWREGLQNPVKGEAHGCNVYSEELVHKICELLQKGASNFEIRTWLNLISTDKLENLSYIGLVGHLRRRTSWNHINILYSY